MSVSRRNFLKYSAATAAATAVEWAAGCSRVVSVARATDRWARRAAPGRTGSSRDRPCVAGATPTPPALPPAQPTNAQAEGRDGCGPRAGGLPLGRTPRRPPLPTCQGRLEPSRS